MIYVIPVYYRCRIRIGFHILDKVESDIETDKLWEFSRSW
jgi:hypothetical protein